MSVRQFGKSPSDQSFNEIVGGLISAASSDVRVIAGELSAYDVASLKMAAQAAIRRGARVTTYANSPKPDVLREIRSLGARAKIGTMKARHHYLVTDGRNVVVSWKPEGHVQTESGTREGLVYSDEPEMASAVIAYQRFLDDHASGVNPSKSICDLLVAAERYPSLVREIHLWDNVFEVLGMENSEKKALLHESQRRLGRWFGEDSTRAGHTHAAVPLLNAVALCVAAFECGRMSSERAGIDSEMGPEQLTAEDTRRIAQISRPQPILGHTARPA